MGTEKFVCVVESPDLRENIIEGFALCNALKLAGIDNSYRLVLNENQFEYALKNLFIECHKRSKLPVLHLSMHGNSKGITLSNDKTISWMELHQILYNLMQMTKGKLLICMSTCEGFQAGQMAATRKKDHTFWNLVGSNSEVCWSDAAIAFITFYHLYFKDFDLGHCIKVMNEACGVPDLFECIEGNAIKEYCYNIIDNNIWKVDEA